MSEGPRKIADRYELVAVLGEGGMGVVWRARDTRLQRAVAVKLLTAAAVGSDVARARLIREAHAAAALEHDGIVRVYDVGETDDGGAYLVMELIRGMSLRDAMERGTLSLARRVAVIADAARALGFAHAAGIVHRDVKPDNIMIRDDGRVTLVDFGVAKPVATELVAHAETLAGLAGAGTNLTGVGQLVGTPAYLAPEQAKGTAVSSATDQFALAVTLHEALCGKLPWTGNGIVEIVAAILRDAPQPASASAQVPVELDVVLARAMAKEPADRWADMDAFANALEEAASTLPPDPSIRANVRARASRPSGGDEIPASTSAATPGVSAAKSSTVSPAASTNSGQTATPSPDVPPPKPFLRKLVMTAGALAVIAGGGWLVMNMRARAAGDATTSASAAAALAAPLPAGSVVACPAFEVTGIDAAWLGGAAAGLACERLQIARGGLDATTLVPAELADAPRDVVNAFPKDLLEGAAARERGIAAAKKRAPRWLDGKLDKQLTGYTVNVVLRAADGRDLAHGEGRGVELFEAVRDALKPLIAAAAPLAPEELASLRDWLDVGSVDEAFDLLDVRTAILIEDPVSLKEVCATAARRTDLEPRAAYFTKVACARKLRTGKIAEPPPALDESTPGALITSALGLGTTGGPAAVRERAARLELEREKTKLPEGQARLSIAAAELYHLVGDPRARQLARIAIQASPKAFDWRTSSWHRLVFASEGDAQLGTALAAWHPWEPISHSFAASAPKLTDPTNQTRFLQRGYLLSQRGFYASSYGDLLVTLGDLEAARGVADLTKDELLRMRILIGEGHYGAAFTKVPRLIEELPAAEENASLAFQLANEGVRAAMVLERPSDFVDTVVTRYVTSEPHHIMDAVVPFLSLVTACCFAPRAVGKRCMERIEHLRSEGQLPTIFNGADVVIAGALRFVAEDYAGATKAWRTLLRAPGWLQDPIREAMAKAFDRAGEPDLADEVDAAVLKLADDPKTGRLAWVRGAKRALARGDTARAKKLALAVVDKWRFADEDIPSVREMKLLLSKLPP